MKNQIYLQLKLPKIRYEAEYQKITQNQEFWFIHPLQGLTSNHFHLQKQISPNWIYPVIIAKNKLTLHKVTIDGL